MHEGKKNSEPSGLVSTVLKALGWTIATLAMLSVALQWTSLGYLGGLTLKIVDWYRWAAWSPWQWMGLDLASVLRDAFAVYLVIVGVGIRNKVWKKAATIRTDSQFDDLSFKEWEESLSARLVVFCFYFSVALSAFGSVGTLWFCFVMFILASTSIALGSWLNQLPPNPRELAYLLLVPLAYTSNSMTVVFRFHRLEIVSILSAAILTLLTATTADFVFGDSLKPYADAFPSAPEVGEIPDFSLPPPS